MKSQIRGANRSLYWGPERRYQNRPEITVSPEQLTSDPKQFNEAIGLPKHPVTRLPSPLTPYQLDIIGYQGREQVINKANKIGVTEAILRRMVLKATVGDCKGYQLMLGAQDVNLAIENMSRLQRIFEESKILNKFVRGQPTRKRLYLVDGTTFFVMPRRAAALRGWPLVKYIFYDEAAHYGLLDDEDFLAAGYARLANTQGYLDVVSTPFGPRGYFYRLCKAAEDGGINMRPLTLHYSLGLMAGLITQEFIDDAKTHLTALFAQEFENRFLASQSAAIPAELIDRAATGRYELDLL